MSGGVSPPMARKLFLVEETFTVQRRGTILLPGLAPEDQERSGIGDPLRLLRPDGSELRVAIAGMDWFHPGPGGEIAILVALSKFEVPAGTEVWSVEAEPDLVP